MARGRYLYDFEIRSCLVDASQGLDTIEGAQAKARKGNVCPRKNNEIFSVWIETKNESHAKIEAIKTTASCPNCNLHLILNALYRLRGPIDIRSEDKDEV